MFTQASINLQILQKYLMTSFFHHSRWLEKSTTRSDLHTRIWMYRHPLHFPSDFPFTLNLYPKSFSFFSEYNIFLLIIINITYPVCSAGLTSGFPNPYLITLKRIRISIIFTWIITTIKNTRKKENKNESEKKTYFEKFKHG